MSDLKSKRHAKILELIDKYDIETQEELADRLNESGFSVTQATIHGISANLNYLRFRAVTDVRNMSLSLNQPWK